MQIFAPLAILMGQGRDKASLLTITAFDDIACFLASSVVQRSCAGWQCGKGPSTDFDQRKGEAVMSLQPSKTGGHSE